MIKGFILKGIAGKYLVRTKKGNFTCEITGKIKYEDDRPIVGDFVLMKIVFLPGGRFKRQKSSFFALKILISLKM